MAQTEFATYNALNEALKRDKIAKYGRVSTFLLSTFVNGNNKLYAAEAYKEDICKPGEFEAWRKMMIQKGWICFTLENGKYSCYQPGKRLVKYVNKEKSEKYALATVNELQNVDSKVDALTEELAIMRRAVENLILKHDPPLENKVDVEYDFAKAEIKTKKTKIAPLPPYKPDEESENFH